MAIAVSRVFLKYSKDPENPAKSTSAKGSNLRVHFKNTRETAMAIKGMKLKKAQQFLKDVINHKRAVPFRRYDGGVGRKAQGKLHKHHGSRQARFPEKSCKFILNLLKNAESNAEAKELNLDNLEVVHIQVNAAPTMRRRTYRAHGRINAYMCYPCHVELILTEKETQVPKGEEEKNLVPSTQ